MSKGLNLVEPIVVPPLHPEFRPVALTNRAFVEAAAASGQAVPLVIGLEREEGLRSVYKTQVYAMARHLGLPRAYVYRVALDGES